MSGAATIVITSPSLVWNLYVEYLWNYKPNSWVASAANTFRILSLLMFAPVFILTLIDVISYVIARTLGVIDDTKASTSEVQHDTSSISPNTSSTSPTILNPCTGIPPLIHVQDDSPTSPTAGGEHEDSDKTPMSSPPPTYFHSTMESAGNLKLSGVDMFSPAPSQPPSPTLSRKDLAAHMMHQVPPLSKIVDESGEGSPSEVSSVGSSAFAYGDSSSEEGVQFRKRRAVGGDAESDA
ncbi:hypothetical protein BXZ70DRAFT_964266 [Cristinia sonorae]|uniref:Uncharacterized protein n=1 Tax=Cristinia sonorae TaxID=1940300 RepID=A0A8K0UDA8_9AGAR|nr:hypothetical protein BXZ70DRAFT_964266 [Cristinia sonorae]